MQRQPSGTHPLDHHGFLPYRHAEGQILQFLQHCLSKGFRQCHHPKIRAPKAGTCLLFRQAQSPQNAQQPCFRRAEAHPFRVIHKALAEFHGGACINGFDHLGNAAHHVQSFFTHTQPQAKFGLLARGSVFINQGDLHAQRAVLRQGGFHGGHELWSGQDGLLANHILHGTGFLCHQGSGHHMAASPPGVPFITGALGRLLRGKNNFPSGGACHHIFHQHAGLLQCTDAALAVQCFSGLIFLFSR